MQHDHGSLWSYRESHTSTTSRFSLTRVKVSSPGPDNCKKRKGQTHRDVGTQSLRASVTYAPRRPGCRVPAASEGAAC